MNAAVVRATAATQPAVTTRRRRIVERYGVGRVSWSSMAGSRPTRLAATIPAASGSATSSRECRTSAVLLSGWSSRMAPSTATAASPTAASNGASSAVQPTRRTSWCHSDSGLMPGG
jgi:hypothetical protein